MADLEKVIKGLDVHCTHKSCDDCPYDDRNVQPICLCRLMTDTLELLKEQEPRVLTLEEATGDDECWLEFKPANVGRYADCYMHDTGDRTRVYFTGKNCMSLFDNAEYNRTWRCWTARPTDEQRGATPWDEPPKEGDRE